MIELEIIGNFLENSFGRNIFLVLNLCFVKFYTSETEQAKEALHQAKLELKKKEEFESIIVRSRNKERNLVTDLEKYRGIKLMQKI